MGAGPLCRLGYQAQENNGAVRLPAEHGDRSHPVVTTLIYQHQPVERVAEGTVRGAHDFGLVECDNELAVRA